MSRFKKYCYLPLLLILPAFAFTGPGQEVPAKASTATDSLDIKIGQMILMGINDRKELLEGDTLLEEIKAGRLGGIILFEKNIAKTDSKDALKKLIAGMKNAAEIPLLVSIDEEGGKVHRLKEKYGFVRMPSAAYLGKLNNPDSTYFYNDRLAREMAELGINLNFAPTLDLAINPDNPVIVKPGRSYASDELVVAQQALQCIRAHHANGVKTILKHFPGHGSSASDSHLGIVDVYHSWSIRELYPYNHILKTGECDAVMTAHIINRTWDSASLPATLSGKVINGMLREGMGFKGVVFSDDMQMNAISKNYGFENAIALAINAGVDVLMFGNNVNPKDRPATASEVHAIIRKLVAEGKVTPERIDTSYNRIMTFKKGLRP